MIKAVIFDMDGVLIDSEPIRLKHVQAIFKNIGVKMSKSDYSKFIGTNSQYMWGTIKDRYGLSYSIQELIDMDRIGYFEYISLPDTKLNAIDGIPEFLQMLNENNYKTAVASSSPIDVIEHIVKNIKIKDCFNTLVTGDYVKRSKPEPDIFLFAAEKLGVLPEECVVVEDSCNGVKAAKKAGMKCIGYRNLNSGNQDLSLADIVIDSFRDELCVNIDRI